MCKSNKTLIIPAVMLVLGLGLAACDNGTTSDSGGSVGNNEVSGVSTYIWDSKYEFSTASSGSGAYTIYNPQQKHVTDDGEDSWTTDYDENGKFIWVASEIGTYTWNETNSAVTMRPSKISADWVIGTGDTTLMTKSQMKNYVQSWIKTQIDNEIQSLMDDGGMTQAEAEQAVIAEIGTQFDVTGITTIQQLINKVMNNMFADALNQIFADQPYNYSFADDGGMFLQAALPKPVGTNELAGNTFNGWEYASTDDDGNDVYQKSDMETWTFTGSGYTYTATYSPSDSYVETGTYSYNSTKKYVYFSITAKAGATISDYYKTVTSFDDNPYPDDISYALSNANGNYSSSDYQMYDTNQRVIGQWSSDNAPGPVVFNVRPSASVLQLLVPDKLR
ncbi:MAG: hypothetical protein FWF29_06795 [Treponema sp.]|nr:hypothetical protein [Treponema sp.]